MAQVVSVNVGMPQEAGWAGIGRTSIDKRPVDGPVRVRRLGLEGDQVSNTEDHGGEDKAVYAFSREDLDWWGRELGEEIRDGQFGENLTTLGHDVNEAEVGDAGRSAPPCSRSPECAFRATSSSSGSASAATTHGHG